MTLLQTIRGPRDLKDLSPDQLPLLAAEIRDLLIAMVSRNGGHLGPNLGVVELTIALHRVFDSPVDRILFDTGPPVLRAQAADRAGRPASPACGSGGGLSGYPSRAESEHDVIENSHASTSLSYADGLAKAYQLRGEANRSVVAVIGDGALTGGMAWEALNNIAGVGRTGGWSSWSTTTAGPTSRPSAGWPTTSSAVRISQRYEHVLDYIKTTLSHGRRWSAPPLYETLHGIKKGLKDVLQPQVLFEDLGPEVPRPGRRPRRAGGRAGAAPGPATSAARCSCT